ncbi:vacuolar H+-ATPase V1 sector, subunit C [Terfezia boudieri ATCC MYA-4762]|uniref:V-type proton ATPase subunit C n=1 Tax=Terfezia boudieri ATCC MYA-4762 TaxID=1051890 RepID=A0A3N4LY67_9PEZI|nr:vacuolar H+-ATPase V1 sector, subunit C [Terfezia boudieri ATCC MYA-4762]
MSNSKYILVALPATIVRSGDEDEAFNALTATVSPDAGEVARFNIPSFKIGTLDALVLQADELAKVDQQVESAVAKVADVLRNVCEAGRAGEHKMVNDKPIDQYLRNFTWNKVKYRSERSIGELIEALHKEVVLLDNDLKSKYTQYQAAKSNLIALERKQTGNLSTKSLYGIVTKDDFVTGSEYLETLLIAIPNNLEKDWLKSYEILTPMVVPRSSAKLDQDEEFALYTVTLFKKQIPEFVQKARANKFVPREFTWTDNGSEKAKQEIDSARILERKILNETLRLAMTAWSDEFMAWIHIKALRVYVESVLRYGLPLEYTSAIIRAPNAKAAQKAKKQLDAYNYLGGNAFGRDKKGNIKNDIPGDLMAGDTAEYSAYVYYEFEIA